MSSLLNISFTKTTSILSCLLIISILQACGLPLEQGGSDGSSVIIDDGESGDASDPTLTLGKTLIINTERLDGSEDLSLGNVSLVALNSDFTEFDDDKIPDWEVSRSPHTNNIELHVASTYIEQLNHVIKVRFSDDEIYFAAIPYFPVEGSTTKQVTVNIYTTYILRKLYDEIPDTDTLNSLLPCTTGDPVIGCENQPRAKQDYLSMVSNAVADFNFELPNDLTINQAISVLEEQDEIRRYIEFAIAELTREQSPFAKGTMREVSGLGFDENGNVFSTALPWSKTYNSVFFALSLSSLDPDDSASKTILASSNSTIVGNKELANELPSYPKYQSTTYLTDIRRESALFVDIPYERTTLSFNDLDAYSIDRSEPINTYASAFSLDSFLSRESYLLEGRSLTPVQPGSVSDLKDVAWQYEPIFAKLYHANEYEPDSVFNPAEEPEDIDFGNEPTWLTGGNFSKAANYRVLNPDTADETLGEKLEDINLFSWEIHALQTPSTFSTSALNDKRYGVISLSQKLNNSNNIIEAYGETMSWSASNGIFNLSQPINNDHYRTYTISRNANNVAQSLSSGRGSIEATRTFFTEGSEIADSTAETGVSVINQGILKLDGGVEAPIGHATENGDYFAFSFNTSDTTNIFDRGTGLIIGTVLDDVSPVFPDEEDSLQAIYHIQGNSISLNGDSNILQNLNGSSLLITNRTSDESSEDCHATLSLSRIYVTHTLDAVTNSITAPRLSNESDVSSDSCKVIGKEIELGFNDVLGQALTLKGFISQSDQSSSTPGNVMTLLWLQDDTIGLILAGKDQVLKANFD